MRPAIGTLAAVLPAAAAHAQITWGSYSPDRAVLPFTGSSYSVMAAMVRAAGQQVATAAFRVDAQYLAEVDVFVTGRLFRGPLPEERPLFEDWVLNHGGTLIVLASGIDGQIHTNMTAFASVENYRDVGPQPPISVVAQHALVEGVTDLRINGTMTFDYGPGALLLARAANNAPFMVVLEPQTGFRGNGRILVVGNTQTLTNQLIFEGHDQRFASNIIAWAGRSARPCYADCDRSSGPRVLDIFDFLCFQNRFAQNDPYACDCDTGTGQGVCDIFDFLCFQNGFAAGCL